jgi:hypothetical protein
LCYAKCSVTCCKQNDSSATTVGSKPTTF